MVFFPFPGSGKGSSGKIFLFLPAGTWNNFFSEFRYRIPRNFSSGIRDISGYSGSDVPKALPGSHPGSEGSFSALSILPDPGDLQSFSVRPVDLCQILQLDQIGSVTQDPVCQKMFCQIQGSVIGAIPVKAFFVRELKLSVSENS